MRHPAVAPEENAWRFTSRAVPEAADVLEEADIPGYLFLRALRVDVRVGASWAGAAADRRRHEALVRRALARALNATLARALAAWRDHAARQVAGRRVLERAMDWQAAAVIFAHNHPSGVAEPSQADQSITKTLIQALSLVDVRVLDHLIIGDSEAVSFAERGLI